MIFTTLGAPPQSAFQTTNQQTLKESTGSVVSNCTLYDVRYCVLCFPKLFLNKMHLLQLPFCNVAECLERHHVRCMASLISELARRRRRREQERRRDSLGTRCTSHKLDEPGIDADMLVPLQGQHVWWGVYIWAVGSL